MLITIIFMFCSLVYSITSIRMEKWERSIFYKPFSQDTLPGNKSETIEHVIKKSAQEEEIIIKESLIATAYCLTQNFESNIKISKYVRRGSYLIILSLIGFLFSVIILVVVGVFFPTMAV